MRYDRNGAHRPVRLQHRELDWERVQRGEYEVRRRDLHRVCVGIATIEEATIVAVSVLLTARRGGIVFQDNALFAEVTGGPQVLSGAHMPLREKQQCRQNPPVPLPCGTRGNPHVLIVPESVVR